MSYNTSIPQVNNPTRQSFFQLRSNFQAIDAAFSENHVGLRQDPSFSGMHKVVVFRSQGSDPNTSSTQVALYNKLVSTIPQLFFRPKSNGTPIQLTYQSISTGLDPANPPNYLLRQYSFIAGPFVIYGGLIKAATNGTVVTLLPATTLLYVGLTMVGIAFSNPALSFSAIATSVAANSFTISYNPNLQTKDIYYFAIGKP